LKIFSLEVNLIWNFKETQKIKITVMVLQNYWESGREHKELFFISQHMFYFFVGAIFIVFVRFIFSLKIHRSPLCIFDDFVSTRKLLQVHTSVKISNLIML
jgi:hypothetical protein